MTFLGTPAGCYSYCSPCTCSMMPCSSFFLYVCKSCFLYALVSFLLASRSCWMTSSSCFLVSSCSHCIYTACSSSSLNYSYLSTFNSTSSFSCISSLLKDYLASFPALSIANPLSISIVFQSIDIDLKIVNYGFFLLSITSSPVSISWRNNSSSYFSCP
jgi:hypothetical protein